MAPVGGELRVIYKRFKPHILMVLTHMGYTFLYLITDISFNHGMNVHVFVTYRHALGGLAIFPFAYFLERYRIYIYIYIYIYADHTLPDK
jgi:hypothetical protein